MQKLIFLKYGELSTKKDNRNYFLKILHNNIQNMLHNINIYYDYGRMFIEVNDNNYDEVINKLQKVFGIHEIVVAYKSLDKDLLSIEQNILSLIKDKEFHTFKVEVKISDKS